MKNNTKLHLLDGHEGPQKERWRKDWLEHTRKLIEESDDVALPEDGQYYDKLQSRIMAAVREADAQASRPDGQTWTDSMMTALQRKWEDSSLKRG